tara:strand:+ start:269 stop:634 length:366 start_codon:yes stop_codon:yes gene_type:complete
VTSKRSFIFSVFLILECVASREVFAGEGPWRIINFLKSSDNLSISGPQRTCYENLEGQFRAGRRPDEEILAFRTVIRMDKNFDPWGLTAELMDSRQEFADTETPLGTKIVNAMELIQGYAF